MYLTRDRPGNGDVGDTLTDEVIVNLDYNEKFPTGPGSCVHGPPFPGTNVTDGYDQYEYYLTGHSDHIANKTSFRMSSFRRIAANTALPHTVDIVPFLKAVTKQWPVADDPLGPWLGLISIGMEIYDHSHGTVIFRTAPQFAVEYEAAPVVV